MKFPGEILRGGLLLFASYVYGQACYADGTYSIAARGTSNYVYRGYTRSNNGPSGQLNLDYGHASGIYMGMWLSSVDFTAMEARRAVYESERDYGNESYAEETLHSEEADRASIEFQAYAGMSWALNDVWQLDTQLVGYLYNGNVLNRSYDYGEFYARLNYTDRLSLRAGIAPYAYGYEKTSFNADIQWRYALTDLWEISGGVGGESVTGVPGYAQLYWNLGVVWALGKHVSFDLRYHGRHAIPNYDAQQSALELPRAPLGFPLVASISISF